MSQPKPPSDQAAARKNRLDFLGCGAGGDVKILGRLAKQQVANAAPHDEGLVARILQVMNDFGRMWAELFEPDAMLGLGNGDKLFDSFFAVLSG
jgi:hypothetical protein